MAENISAHVEETLTQVYNLRGSPAKSGPVHFASEKSFPLYFVP